MSHRPARLLLAMSLMLPFATGVGAQETAAAPAAAEGKTLEQSLTEFRQGLLQIETDVVAKTVSLTPEEATAFWPVFKRYQEEKVAVIDAQIAAVREYSDDYWTLTPEDSMAYVESLLVRDQRINELRAKYLVEFAKVLPPGKAARVIHVSRRLGLAGQAKLATEVPLVR
ncbi:hypothetical protein [Arenimonas daejeonensis]|uniref:hypothetical protein n=1 Tax=Arenimonas daejeonensis TaxID=370777 RepID=UPI0011BFDE98|nr:hypothetical protein [Arenimonas daejeonensis]